MNGGRRGMDAIDIEAAREAEGDEDLPWGMVRRRLDGENRTYFRW